MKKRNLFGALATGMLLCACSSENDAISQDLDQVTIEGNQKLILNLSSGGDKMTRAGRPLYSSEAKQDVDHIVLYVVNRTGNTVPSPADPQKATIDNNAIALVKTITAEEWKNATSYADKGHGKALEISFKGSEKQKLAEGKYDIYAVAYKNNKTPNYTFELATTGAKATWTETNFFATLTNKTKTDHAEEIFAGKLTVQVRVKKDNETQKILDTYFVKGDAAEGETGNAKPNPGTISLVLNRQVAGVTGYFQNIPVSVAGIEPTKLRLVASNKSDKMLFTSLYGSETPNPGETNSAETNKNIVNGCQSGSAPVKDAKFFDKGEGTAAYTVYEIELNKFFPNITGGTQNGTEPKILADLDASGDGYIGYADFSDSHKDANRKYWANPFNSDNKTGNGLPTYSPGTVFAGEFIIPFALVDGQKTFELQLIGNEGNTEKILKTWNVGTDKLIKDGKFAVGVKDKTQTKACDEETDKLIYNIYRNHMYSMGIKKSDDDGGKDPTPDPDKNDPEDLSKGENLLLHVNDNWELIHQMEID